MAAEAQQPKSGPSDTHITSAGAFFRWWRGELFGLLSPAWRDRLRPGRATLVVSDGEGWKTYRLLRGALVEDRAAPTGRAPGALQQANVWLLLTREEVLVRDAALPLAAEEALDEALGFELDLLTPLSGEQAYFGHDVIARNVVEKQLIIRLGVARRDVVDRRVMALRRLGARVLGVGVLEEYSGESRSLNLLPASERDKPRMSSEVAATRALAAVAAVLAIAALIYPLWLKREAFIALQPRVDKARSAAEVSNRLAGQIEALAKEHNFLLSKRLAQPSMAVLVEELSRQLPDNTWVQQLDVKPGPKTREVQLAGETGSSSALVEVLERSGHFANATFKSPLTKGVTPNTERFLLAAELKSRELPVPVADDLLRAGAVATPEPSVPAGVVAPPPR